MREMADAGNPGGSVPEDERHTVRAPSAVWSHSQQTDMFCEQGESMNCKIVANLQS
ncbi:Uncharacterised protein [Salmonella enterica subsp. indica]|uniref:Uncharacterized protein n=1 Tax=Salmonella enterica subsp. indica TaxID=59207 RepID=A0A379XL86_SALER|nr:Uncharacterised protein [Salmonella enterica subsp. indica]